MRLRPCSIGRALRRDFSAAWFAVPALLLVALLGAVLLAGVLRELPPASGTDDGGVAVEPAPGGGGGA